MRLDYLDNIDIYQIDQGCSTSKDAEFNPPGGKASTARFQGLGNRAGRFRSPGDGQVDFGSESSQDAPTTSTAGAVVEWGIAPSKHPRTGRAEGAEL